MMIRPRSRLRRRAVDRRPISQERLFLKEFLAKVDNSPKRCIRCDSNAQHHARPSANLYDAGGGNGLQCKRCPREDLMTEVRRKRNEAAIRKRLLQARKSGELPKDLNVDDYTQISHRSSPVSPCRQRMVQPRRNSSEPRRWPFGIWVTKPHAGLSSFVTISSQKRVPILSKSEVPKLRAVRSLGRKAKGGIAKRTLRADSYWQPKKSPAIAGLFLFCCADYTVTGFAAASLAVFTNALKAAASFVARSERIFRSSSIPASFSPWISCE